MKLQLIRNGTLRFTYAGHAFVTDPYLADKHSLPSYAGNSPNPLVELPMPAEAVLAGIEMALLSHLHTDHFDPRAQALLPKDTPVLCQPGNETRLNAMGFSNVTPVADEVRWNGIKIGRVPGRHGSSEAILQAMSYVSGFVFEAQNEPTVYWAGDTVWYDEVKATIARWQPEIIITHSGGAVWGGERELIMMDAAQTVDVGEYAANSIVVAVHMEALDHCLTSRAELRLRAAEHGLSEERLRIPANGETLEF